MDGRSGLYLQTVKLTRQLLIEAERQYQTLLRHGNPDQQEKARQSLEHVRSIYARLQGLQGPGGVA